MLHASSSPQMLGRPSSPLNPYAERSSSPVTSPTPPYFQAKRSFSFSLYDTSGPSSGGTTSSLRGSNMARHSNQEFHRTSGSGAGPSSSPTSNLTTRYQRPSTRRPGSTGHVNLTAREVSSPDLFAEGTTPTEGAMWRERFSRRMEERERRRKARQVDLDRRRSSDASPAMDDLAGSEAEEEAERRAQADDEEIFRRLMVMQRQRAQRAALISLEDQNGGSDPDLPEFWEDELNDNGDGSGNGNGDGPRCFSEHDYQSHPVSDVHRIHPHQHNQHPPFLTPPSGKGNKGKGRATPLYYAHSPHTTHTYESEEEQWAREAAEAEEAERQAEEAELMNRLEGDYTAAEADRVMPLHEHRQDQHHVDVDMSRDTDMDWDAFDSMDVE